MNTEMFVHNISEDQSVMWWECLGDLQICPILSFKIDSFMKEFITVLYSQSCWIEWEAEHMCPCFFHHPEQLWWAYVIASYSKRTSLADTYFVIFGLDSHSSGAVSRMFSLFAIPSAYLNPHLATFSLGCILSEITPIFICSFDDHTACKFMWNAYVWCLTILS